jgi:hypothetical protein
MKRMTAPDRNSTATPARPRLRRKVIFQGVEILPPAAPPDTPMWKLRRAVKRAVKQYKVELAEPE